MSLFDGLELTDIPLAAFPNVRTTDVALLEASVSTMYGRVHFDIGRDRERFAAVANRLKLNSIGLSYASHGSAVEIGLKDAQFFAHVFSVSGKASAETRTAIAAMDGNETYICSEGDSVLLKYAPDFEQMIVRYDSAMLRNKLLLLTGDNRVRSLRFHPTASAEGTAGALERQLVRRLVKMAEQEDMSPIAMAELEQAIVVAFLFGNRHTFIELLTSRPTAVAPWQVRRAEAFIEANWSRAILIEEVAAACDTSVRNLFHTFKNSRGYTPTEFLRKVRLSRAREMLTNPSNETSVTHVALTCGFANVGHFAKHFRRQYNEVPSTTLNRAKAKRL